MNASIEARAVQAVRITGIQPSRDAGDADTVSASTTPSPAPTEEQQRFPVETPGLGAWSVQPAIGPGAAFPADLRRFRPRIHPGKISDAARFERAVDNDETLRLDRIDGLGCF